MPRSSPRKRKIRDYQAHSISRQPILKSLKLNRWNLFFLPGFPNRLMIMKLYDPTVVTS